MGDSHSQPCPVWGADPHLDVHDVVLSLKSSPLTVQPHLEQKTARHRTGRRQWMVITGPGGFLSRAFILNV